ncbi:MarR family winged helix-turn-helix transcriptional regulator [Mycobacterium sp. SMC-4]|uniref:MarR family winged helix-turn-helix transcriptional regulator n=1 Tax=Mycobacterium sp. SMC-4 TaxID=2857059 RepID=UPI0021B3A4EA|nr:MarR family winged helix-turn-helix transcriptional regulator [Mycobacterium sp. SMC-4]UXA17327.1 MarR family winged helix-turn-helix transcriptional regulator [Mycobacterium sp. SMC-4]
MSGKPLADEVWRDLAAFVHNHRDGWKRAVIERAGLPFSRIRILMRLRASSMTVKELAAAAAIDAPAATVAVNDLQDRGLVVREVDPDNRRCKKVSLTASGRAVLDAVDAVHDPAPAVVSHLATDELRTLRRILDRMLGC